MSDEDDATVMMSAMSDDHPAMKFKDVGGEEDEATVMWSPEQGGAPGGLIGQDDATVMMTGAQAQAAIAQRAAAPKKAKAAPASGSNKSALGGLGALLSYASIITVFALIKSGDSAFFVTGGLMIAGYGLMGKAFMGAGGAAAKMAGMASLAFAVSGILVILFGAGIMRGVALIGLLPWIAGVAWVFAGLWGFKRGGGAGIFSGILNIIGGGCGAAAGVIGLGGDVNSAAALLLGALGALAIGSILLAVIMFTKLDRHA